MGDSTRGRRSSIVSGSVLIALGAWAALAPFLVAGWDWNVNSGRFLLTVVPGAAAVIGGLLMLGQRPLLVKAGGGVALAGGAWFVLAPLAYALFVGTQLGTLASGEPIHMLRWIVFFFGAGVVVSFLGAYSLKLIVPLTFEGDLSTQTAIATSRARVPLAPERPRRQRGAKEPTAPRPATPRSSKPDA
jgi:MFS family permease